jgi:hypothetical protein
MIPVSLSSVPPQAVYKKVRLGAKKYSPPTMRHILPKAHPLYRTQATRPMRTGRPS